MTPHHMVCADAAPVAYYAAPDDVRRRIRTACDIAGASDVVCDMLDATAERESHYRAGAEHTLGRREYGIGAMGLSVRWHGHRWRGSPSDWCWPEVSAIIVLGIWRDAWDRYGARSPAELHAVFAGRWVCGGGRCIADVTMRTVRAICPRLRARGHDCHARLRDGDLGRSPTDARDLARAAGADIRDHDRDYAGPTTP